MSTLSSEYGTYKTIEVRLSPWLSGKGPESLSHVPSSIGSGTEAEGPPFTLNPQLPIVVDKGLSDYGFGLTGVPRS